MYEKGYRKLEKGARKMKLLIGTVALFTSCSALPQLGQDATTILTDNVLSISVQKEAMQKETDLKITVEITNKDPVN